jgi:signal transduction histidine kinase
MDGSSLVGVPASGGDYHALFEQSAIPMALIAMRDEPHLVAASRGFLDAFDFGRAAVVGRPLAKALASSDSAALVEAIRRCLMTSESLHTNVELHGKAGRRLVGVAVHDARARGFTGHVVLQAEVARQVALSAERRLASLFDRSDPQGQSLTYLHVLKTGRVRYGDAGLAHRLNLSPSPMYFRELRARIHPDDLVGEAEFEAKRRALGEEEFLNSIVRVRDREGEWRLINFRSRVFRRDQDGAVRVMLGIATDLTDYSAAARQVTGAKVLEAEENERARIGRELHDSTSQYLVAADLGLARVLKSVDLSVEERARLEGVQASLATAQTEMRAFSYFLHPPELREFGLANTLRKFCTGFARRSGLQIDYCAADVPENVSSDVQHALFRVGQESLMNVYRHAFARRVSVSLGMEDGYLALQVRDDGIGIDGDDRVENGGVGLSGMKARMLSVGGEFSLDHQGAGLAVIARAPLPPE